jgi:hypothetical protein
MDRRRACLLGRFLPRHLQRQRPDAQTRHRISQVGLQASGGRSLLLIPAQSGTTPRKPTVRSSFGRKLRIQTGIHTSAYPTLEPMIASRVNTRYLERAVATLRQTEDVPDHQTICSPTCCHSVGSTCISAGTPLAPRPHPRALSPCANTGRTAAFGRLGAPPRPRPNLSPGPSAMTLGIE